MSPVTQLLAASVMLAWSFFHPAVAQDTAPFDWSSITPTKELRYHPCYEGFQCARLSVPRDWLDESFNKTVVLAVIALPATVPSDDPSFGGTIVTNPGGPGGSGVNSLRSYGKRLQQMTEGKKHYEILSFDPRGVGVTWPQVDCFGRSHLFARDSFLLEQRGSGPLSASDSSLKRNLALYDGYGNLCREEDLDEDIQAYVSTAAVARDIIEITDRVHEHRHSEKESSVLHDAQPQGQHQLAAEEDKSGAPPRVLYWGFSYVRLHLLLLPTYPLIHNVSHTRPDGASSFPFDIWLTYYLAGHRSWQYSRVYVPRANGKGCP